MKHNINIKIVFIVCKVGNTYVEGSMDGASMYILRN